MTPDEARADDRRRIMERLEARAVSEDVCADRNAALSLPERLVGKHEYAASVLREEARAIAALGPVAPVDDALLHEVMRLTINEIDGEVAKAEESLRKARRREAASEMRIIGKFIRMHLDRAAIIERAKGGA